MLTRSQVAKRLRRSIATVRRMEGHELHPQKDERGVHRFDAEEVAEVARGRVHARPTEGRASDDSDELLAFRQEQCWFPRYSTAEISRSFVMGRA